VDREEILVRLRERIVAFAASRAGLGVELNPQDVVVCMIAQGAAFVGDLPSTDNIPRLLTVCQVKWQIITSYRALMISIAFVA